MSAPASARTSTAGAVLQRKPSQVTAYSFLGIGVGGGINPTLRSRLDDVITELRARFNSEHSRPPADDAELRTWAGVNSMGGWRESSSTTSKHCSGSAVDVNYRNQPYIVTRTGTTLGGEAAGANLAGVRQATVAVFDRAVEFVLGSGPADVSGRTPVAGTTPRETTSSVYRRFRSVSDAVGTYLSLAFHSAPDRVNRQPINNIGTATEAALLAGIPVTERLGEAEGIEAVRQYILNHDQSANPGDPAYHWNWEDSFMARDYYFQMLRDYEWVRVPMVAGNPAARPGITRNPARGFLDMPEHFVVAMVDTGDLRWGISDLGSAQNGDTHHFDLGDHGGVAPDCTA